MSDHHADTPEGVARLAMDLSVATGVDETVDLSLQYARVAVGADAASVMLLEHRGRDIKIAGTSGAEAAKADQLQLELNEGPCLDAARHIARLKPAATERSAAYTFMTHQIEDTLDEDRWPVWSARIAADLDLRSVLSIQLRLPNVRIGVLNLYSTKPHRFAPHDRQIAELLAQHTALAVAAEQHSVNLWEAIDARQLIGQAQGLLMERYGMSAPQSFAVLRRYSQDYNLKLHDVAQQLLQKGQLPEAAE